MADIIAGGLSGFGQGTGLRQQLIPIAWRMTAVQYFEKHALSVVWAFAGAAGVLVIHPRQHDDAAGRMLAKNNRYC